MDNQAYLDDLIARSRAAQKIVENYTQEQVDAICYAMAKAIYDNAEPLAKLAVEESRMGVYENKVAKNQGKSRIIWNSLKGKKSVGIIRVLEEEGIVEIAKPMGVIGAATPCTNPIVTPMCNAMFAVKGRNTIIISPHPRSKRCTKAIKELYDAEFEKLGVPKDIFLYIEEPSNELSALLMKNVDVVLATGGPGVVKAAYSSGKPSYGVGAGNVQGILDTDIDIKAAVKKIVASRTFDNGIICSGDQTIIAPRCDYDAIINEFKAQGAYYVEDKETVDKVRETVFPNGVMNKNLVGQSALKLAEAAGLDVPADTKMIIVKAAGCGKDDLFSKEKMCPLMSAYAYDTWEEAVAIANANLNVEGKGHSVSIQSNNKEHIEYAGEVLPVSRVLVNQICATQNGGAFSNSLSPTTTLGCGSWGNNSISENLSYYHLYNVTRVAYEKEGWSQPSDEEIWAK
ncbi:MAG: aldehyde dehydrogenase family protein [Clostridia bacterium]|nr:aldehyde dehydrogenase family protein [Clostridia bacterium]